MHFCELNRQDKKTNFSMTIRDLNNILARASYYHNKKAPISQVQGPLPEECKDAIYQVMSYAHQ